MFAPLAKILDWSSVQAVTLMMPANDLSSKLEEALQFLKGPEFIPVESLPAEIEFNGAVHFTFPTPQPCEFPENNVVHGRLYRCAGQWQERPVIILLPGWKDSASYNLRFPRIARQCNRAGFNVVTLVPPYHFQRSPRQRRDFDRGDCLQFVKGEAQAICEIRALTGRLLGEGCPAVALWGYSAGAWYAGMLACRDARLAAVVLACHHGRTSPALEKWAVRPSIRANFPRVSRICNELNLTPMNLSTSRPAIAKKKILMIEGVHDLLCPQGDIEDLWQAWEQTAIWRLPYGHVEICCGFARGLPGRVLEWLKPKLEAGRTNSP